MFSKKTLKFFVIFRARAWLYTLGESNRTEVGLFSNNQTKQGLEKEDLTIQPSHTHLLGDFTSPPRGVFMTHNEVCGPVSARETVKNFMKLMFSFCVLVLIWTKLQLLQPKNFRIFHNNLQNYMQIKTTFFITLKTQQNLTNSAKYGLKVESRNKNNCEQFHIVQI